MCLECFVRYPRGTVEGHFDPQIQGIKSRAAKYFASQQPQSEILNPSDGQHPIDNITSMKMLTQSLRASVRILLRFGLDSTNNGSAPRSLALRGIKLRPWSQNGLSLLLLLFVKVRSQYLQSLEILHRLLRLHEYDLFSSVPSSPFSELG